MADLGSNLALRALALASLLGPIADLDGTVQRAVQAWRPTALETPMRLATGVGRPQIVMGGLLAVAVLGGPAGVATVRCALLAMIPTNLIVETTKRATRRTRPDGENRPSNSSFPSSHAANAFALAAVLSGRWKRLAPLLFLLATAVGFSRIYLNRHFLSDVLVGAVIGLTCAWIATVVLDRWTRARSSGPEMEGAS